MGNIDWLPIDSLPESHKDGRLLLLWTDTRYSTDLSVYMGAGGRHFAEAQIGFWEDDVEAAMRTDPAGWRLQKVGEPTHWAEINPPGEVEKA